MMKPKKIIALSLSTAVVGLVYLQFFTKQDHVQDVSLSDQASVGLQPESQKIEVSPNSKQPPYLLKPPSNRAVLPSGYLELKALANEGSAEAAISAASQIRECWPISKMSLEEVVLRSSMSSHFMQRYGKYSEEDAQNCKTAMEDREQYLVYLEQAAKTGNTEHLRAYGLALISEQIFFMEEEMSLLAELLEENSPEYPQRLVDHIDRSMETDTIGLRHLHAAAEKSDIEAAYLLSTTYRLGNYALVSSTGSDYDKLILENGRSPDYKKAYAWAIAAEIAEGHVKPDFQYDMDWLEDRLSEKNAVQEAERMGIEYYEKYFAS